MNFINVVTQLNDLPATYTRIGAPYTQLVDSEAAALSDFTTAADATIDSVLDISNAQWGWLDVWGLLLGLPRYQDEGDSRYLSRVQYLLTCLVGTPMAIQLWGTFLFGQPVVVTENLPNVGYAITIPSGVNVATINQFVQSLSRIRPVGVPFTLNQIVGGLYLDTINFFDAQEVEGGYLDDGTKPVNFVLSSVTPDAVPLLPDIYFSDPLLNPELVGS